MSPESLWVLSLLLFLDGATFAIGSSFLLLHYGRYHEPWKIALAGGMAGALGSVLQLLILRAILNPRHRWLSRFAPSRDKLEASLRGYRSASFMAILVARATPLPDAPIKIVAAVVRYPVALYGLACLLGSIPYFYALALVGSKIHVPVWILLAALGLVVAGALFDRWRRRRGGRS